MSRKKCITVKFSVLTDNVNVGTGSKYNEFGSWPTLQ